MTDRASEIAAAMTVLDDFMAAFNARDIEAFEATFNFPNVRLASNTLRLIQKPASIRSAWSPARTATGA